MFNCLYLAKIAICFRIRQMLRFANIPSGREIEMEVSIS
jgi:hypothetical protein